MQCVERVRSKADGGEDPDTKPEKRYQGSETGKGSESESLYVQNMDLQEISVCNRVAGPGRVFNYEISLFLHC
jgi:hypothetical protein